MNRGGILKFYFTLFALELNEKTLSTEKGLKTFAEFKIYVLVCLVRKAEVIRMGFLLSVSIMR